MANKGVMLEHMIRLAATAHADQLDKGDHPYILHPLAVMHKIYVVYPDDEDLLCIAVGHDMVEDNKEITFKGLWVEGFNDRIINGIDALTKRRGEELDEYKARVKANKDAILVKMADLEHNSDIKRLKGISPKDVERMIRYHAFWLELRDELELYNNTYKRERA